MRGQRFRSSLRGQLLVVVLAALGPALVFVLWGANREKGRALAASEADGRRLLTLLARGHEASLGVTRKLLEGMAEFFEERGGLPVPAECARSLANLRRVEPRYATLLLAAPDGRVLCSSPEGPGEVLLADRPYFQKAVETAAFTMGEFQVGRISGKPSVALVQPVRGPAGALLALAVASIDLDWLGAAIARAHPEGRTILFLDRQGTVLARHPEGSPAAGSRFLLAARLAELAENGGMAEERSAGGRDSTWWQVGRLSGDGEAAGYLALGVPAGVLFDAASRALTRQLFVLALVAAVAVGGVWVFADALVVPRVEALSASVRRLEAGDLSARSAIPEGGGELGALAAAFDGMAASLERRSAERDRAEAELRRSEDALRALTERLETVREEEGKRIARELHDEVGQALTGLKIDLAALKRALPEASWAAAGERVTSMGRLADATIETVRRISAELRPPLLDQLGLVAAVEAHLERFAGRTGLRARFQGTLGEGALDRQRASVLFRILQEALTNVIRHAGAAGVDVRIGEEGEAVVLTVTDDGRGFVERPGPSLGILGMRERARAAGGTVTVVGAPGRGTTVTARLPRSAGAAPREASR